MAADGGGRPHERAHPGEQPGVGQRGQRRGHGCLDELVRGGAVVRLVGRGRGLLPGQCRGDGVEQGRDLRVGDRAQGGRAPLVARAQGVPERGRRDVPGAGGVLAACVSRGDRAQRVGGGRRPPDGARRCRRRRRRGRGSAGQPQGAQRDGVVPAARRDGQGDGPPVGCPGGDTALGVLALVRTQRPRTVPSVPNGVVSRPGEQRQPRSPRCTGGRRPDSGLQEGGQRGTPVGAGGRVVLHPAVLSALLALAPVSEVPSPRTGRPDGRTVSPACRVRPPVARPPSGRGIDGVPDLLPRSTSGGSVRRRAVNTFGRGGRTSSRTACRPPPDHQQFAVRVPERGRRQRSGSRAGAARAPAGPLRADHDGLVLAVGEDQRGPGLGTVIGLSWSGRSGLELDPSSASSRRASPVRPGCRRAASGRGSATGRRRRRATSCSASTSTPRGSSPAGPAPPGQTGQARRQATSRRPSPSTRRARAGRPGRGASTPSAVRPRGALSAVRAAPEAGRNRGSASRACRSRRPVVLRPALQGAPCWSGSGSSPAAPGRALVEQVDVGARGHAPDESRAASARQPGRHPLHERVARGRRWRRQPRPRRADRPSQSAGPPSAGCLRRRRARRPRRTR